MEELQSRHRKQQRELQALVTQKKKSASKKSRKGVNDECARLEAELKERHERELAELNGDASLEEHHDEEEPEEKPLTTHTNGTMTGAVINGVSPQAADDDQAAGAPQSRGGKKPNRQKARLARRAAEREEDVAKAEEEASNMPDLRAKEQETMDAAIKAKGLRMREIRADGHCLYSAVADQLSERGIGLRPRIRPTVVDEKEQPYRTVRRTAAEYIMRNKGDFEPFLDESLDEYVRKVGETGEWGGQLELTALAKAYRVNIGVLDGNGGVHEIQGTEDGQDSNESRTIWLAYYRHGFGLGEHYNSLRKDG